jgi:hypothetical protein
MSVLRWILIAIIWIAIEFWPAQIADRKGHSFIGYLHLQPVLLPGCDHRRLPRPRSHPGPTQASGCQLLHSAGPGHHWRACLDNTAEKAGLQALCPALPLSGRPICAGHSGL